MKLEPELIPRPFVRSTPIVVEFTKLDPLAETPRRAFDDDAGFDLFLLEDAYVAVGEKVVLKTGIAVATPPGWYARIVGRSSAHAKRGLVVFEGTIDAGYRGELLVCAWNPGIRRHAAAGVAGGMLDVQLEAGQSIAQLLILPVPKVQMREVGVLPESERGTNGFGSTG